MRPGEICAEFRSSRLALLRKLCRARRLGVDLSLLGAAERIEIGGLEVVRCDCDSGS